MTTINLNDYRDVLEDICNNNIVDSCDSEYSLNLTDENLYKIVDTFLDKYNISNVLISLSGGVDSMVLTEIICKIREENQKKTNGKKITIYTVFINYNNREESNREKQFLTDYCIYKNICFTCIDLDFKRDQTKRKIYEEKTREIRYNCYKNMSELYNCSGVFLGHHRDDLCENIFNNIMRGSREITDLCVLKETNNILGVEVFRPMLNQFKSEIYDVAHKYNIPYFLDTTPDWSCRGKMRRNIFPDCVDCYGDNYKNNLLKLGRESTEMGYIFDKYIIDKLFTDNFTYTEKCFTIKRCDILCELCVLKVILKKIVYFLKIDNIKYKNVEILSRLLNSKTDDHIGKKFTFVKNYYTTVDKYYIQFVKCL